MLRECRVESAFIYFNLIHKKSLIFKYARIKFKRFSVVAPAHDIARGSDVLRDIVVSRLASKSVHSSTTATTMSATTSPPLTQPVQQFVTLPALPVNYVALCVPGVPFTHRDAPALTLLVRCPVIFATTFEIFMFINK